jgi:catechol 2,3-dioxygenase
VGFEVWSEDDLKASVATSKAKGLAVEREIDHPARHSVMIRDPDGLYLQFFVNRNWSPDALNSVNTDDALYLL